MYKLTSMFLLSAIGQLAGAQTIRVEKPVICADLKTVIETVSGDFQEQPTWRGNDEKSKYIMFSNSKTGTWTMIQYKDNLACIVGTGENSKSIFIGKTV